MLVSQLAAGSSSTAIIGSLRDELSELQRSAAGVSDAAERQQLLLLEGDSHRSLAEAAAQPGDYGDHMGTALLRYLAGAEAGSAAAADESAQASLRAALLVNDLLRVGVPCLPNAFEMTFQDRRKQTIGFREMPGAPFERSCSRSGRSLY